MITLALWFIENIDTISLTCCRGAVLLVAILIAWMAWAIAHAPEGPDREWDR